MSKGKSFPQIPPNHKLIVKHKPNGDTEYIIKPVEDEYEYSSQIWAWVFFAVMMLCLFIMFGKH